MRDRGRPRRVVVSVVTTKEHLVRTRSSNGRMNGRLLASVGVAWVGVAGVMTTAAPAAACVMTPARGDDQPNAALAERVVFEVTVQYSTAPAALPIQPGFLVGPDGVGVTSYSSLHSAVGATARFVGSPITYKVE